MARGRRKYKPAMPFNVAMCLLVPTYEIVKGVRKPVFPEPDPTDKRQLLYGSFRTFGGTESTENNIYTVTDTATIDTWFNPSIRADCRLYICETGETYEIKSNPENIEMRNQFLQIRVERIGGAK